MAKKLRNHDKTILIRLDSATKAELDYLSDITGLSRTAVVRRLVTRDALRVKGEVDRGNGQAVMI